MNRHNLKLLFSVVLFYGLLAVVNTIVLGKAELCFVRMICGLPCPGCGITHSVIALLSGHLWESLKYYPFTIFALATSFGWLMTFRKQSTSLPRPIFRTLLFLGHNRYWLSCLLFAILSYYIVRFALFFPRGPYPMIYSPNNYMALAWNSFQKAWHYVFH